MIDPTKTTGLIQNLLANNNRSPAPERPEPRQASAPVDNAQPRDRVDLSEKAISLSQAEQSASEARRALEENRDVSLGLDPGFDEEV